MDTVQIATTEFLQTQISALQEAIQNKDAIILSLQERSSKNSQREYATAAEIQLMRDNMHEWTIEEFKNSQITESQAEAIAEICGFELTQEVEAEVSAPAEEVASEETKTEE